jgi:hypothetical protein
MLATTGKHAPPPAAAFVNVAFGLATVAGAIGLTRGARWARRVTIGALVIRLITGVLALGATIPVLLRAEGFVTFALSAVALVLVVRTRRQLPAAIA